MSRIKIVLPPFVNLYNGMWYRYGGRGLPDGGIDCSQLCVEFLKELGELHESQDFTAHGIVAKDVLSDWRRFKWTDEHLALLTFDLIPPGSLLFMDWQDDGRIDHCSIYLGNDLHLHAQGGNLFLQPPKDKVNGVFLPYGQWPDNAKALDARVKIRPVDWSQVDVVAIPPTRLR